MNRVMDEMEALLAEEDAEVAPMLRGGENARAGVMQAELLLRWRGKSGIPAGVLTIRPQFGFIRRR